MELAGALAEIGRKAMTGFPVLRKRLLEFCSSKGTAYSGSVSSLIEQGASLTESLGVTVLLNCRVHVM